MGVTLSCMSKVQPNTRATIGACMPTVQPNNRAAVSADQCVRTSTGAGDGGHHQVQGAGRSSAGSPAGGPGLQHAAGAGGGAAAARLPHPGHGPRRQLPQGCAPAGWPGLGLLGELVCGVRLHVCLANICRDLSCCARLHASITSSWSSGRAVLAAAQQLMPGTGQPHLHCHTSTYAGLEPPLSTCAKPATCS